MRRLSLAFATCLLLALPATASATVTTTSDPSALAAAIAPSGVTSASFFELPPGTPHGTSDSTVAGFPTSGGTFAILTTGDATSADDPNAPNQSTADGTGPAHGYKGAPGNAYDTSVLQLNIDVPQGQTCVGFDFRFLSEEWPDNVGANVNDGFIAGIDTLDAAGDPSGDISAPQNFAFDENGSLVSLNTASMSAAEAAGTPYGGATQLLHAQRSVTAGAHTLYLAIFDQGDAVVDSAVFVDNLQFTNATQAACDRTVDRSAPQPSLGEPTDGSSTSSPVYSGQAGTAVTDSTNVTVQVYPGDTATGTPVDVETATVQSDGSWAVGDGVGLQPGRYTAQAHQTDRAGNVGDTATHTFTVTGADTTAPAVGITSPANGSSTGDTTPTLSGTAGTAPDDSPDVGVELRAGTATTGPALQNLVAQRDGAGHWSATAATLQPGQYTAVASQFDASGNRGQSPPVTFTVNAQPRPSATPTPTPQQQVQGTQQQSPEPVLGQTVVAGSAGGTVRVKGRDGKFHILGANEAIPVGSTVDATKGKVRLTSASGPGGATQSALFYQGVFKVTQTKGAKPITQLALTGTLSCPKAGKASASARKRVRRLWGDGKGRFRTKGRHGAATVRGTKWLTQDTCDATLVRVARGVVAVRDFAKRKTVLVKKGHSYVARPKKKKK